MVKVWHPVSLFIIALWFFLYACMLFVFCLTHLTCFSFFLQFSPLIQDTILKGTFNATLNNPIAPQLDMSQHMGTNTKHAFLLGVWGQSSIINQWKRLLQSNDQKFILKWEIIYSYLKWKKLCDNVSVILWFLNFILIFIYIRNIHPHIRPFSCKVLLIIHV